MTCTSQNTTNDTDSIGAFGVAKLRRAIPQCRREATYQRGLGIGVIFVAIEAVNCQCQVDRDHWKRSWRGAWD